MCVDCYRYEEYLLICKYIFQVSLSAEAEKALEEAIQEKTNGDTVYFWARLDMDKGVTGSKNMLTFWSMCDIINGGNCR